MIGPGKLEHVNLAARMTQLWQHSRGYIGPAALLTLAALSLAGGWQAYAWRLPDPATADQQGLMRWLVTRDIESEPAELQNRLVKRLEQELRAGVDLSRVDEAVDRQRRERFWRNVDALLQRWFVEQVDQFHDLPDPQRPEFIRHTIDDLLTWEFVRARRAEYAGQAPSSREADQLLLAECEQRVARWRNQIDREQADRYNRLVVHVKAELMRRYLMGEL